MTEPFPIALDLEEGSPCPLCFSPLAYPAAENCSCHIAPPCSSCLSVVLTCEACGFREDDDQ